ncbi:dipeptidase [Anditalea andensis]|uniref:Peptidase n=1 Tax=Anditalea andensis TaxID=1048983 RepID=A0A074L0G3_9BACT|nr:membrane dipeptidase [Anditalea andensis]KEO73363.1 peptidase [Anditalea andensis]
MTYPIIDTHCDLLSYLAKVQGAAPDSRDIPCGLPYLKEGNVKMQVLAIYTDVRPESMDIAYRQVGEFKALLENHKEEVCLADRGFLATIEQQKKIGLVCAIENAAGLANETAKWSDIYQLLDKIIADTGRLAYISLTHHTENRFGGGNYTDVGLKDDGRKLLDYIDGKKIAIDLSHTSDLLAEGILEHLTTNSLDIPVIASHSNFRTIWDHKRNITDEFAKEIIHRKGIVGVNFLRAFLDDATPERLFDHIKHGFAIGAEDCICFGADFFYTKDFPDKSRHPFYFPLAENASNYPSLMESLSNDLPDMQLQKLAYKNCQRFFKETWV